MGKLKVNISACLLNKKEMSLTLDWLPMTTDIVQLTWLQSVKWWGYTNYECQTQVSSDLSCVFMRHSDF